MPAIINPYFHKSQINEQTLVSSLIKESIQIQGRKYFYLPRNVQIMDLVLGEDIVSRFSLAIPIEAYLVEAQGFQGDKEMFSKFGLQINNSYRLVVHKDRWEREVKPLFDGDIGNGEADFTIENYLRPHEGDLIFDPLTNFLMEIKFVDHDTEFYQLGKNYMYHMSCEAFNYQNESIGTGIEAIDMFENNNRDALVFQILLEDGKAMLCEDFAFMILEEEATLIRRFEVDLEPEKSKIDFTVTDPFNY